MDLLSDVIRVMRTGQPRLARVTWYAPWAQEFASVPGAAGFQVVLQGPCWLLRPGSDPVALAAGDLVFRPRGDGHVLAGSPAPHVVAAACGPEDRPSRHPITTGVVGSGGAGDTEDRTTGDAAPPTVTICGAYQLATDGVHPLLDELPDLIHLPGHLGQDPELDATVRLLARELDQPGPGTGAIVPALLDTLLLYILRAYLDLNPASASARRLIAARHDPPVAAALRAIHTAPGRPWSVATLAAEGGLSRTPFARHFTEVVGQPPLTYLTRWRMTIAARLLRETDVPLSAVAARVGYASESAFASAFKRRYGTAPGRYRLQYRVLAAGAVGAQGRGKPSRP